MPNEGFFRRWSRLKSGDGPAQEARTAPPGGPSAAAPGGALELPPLAQETPHPPVALARSGAQRPPPTMDDLALLGPDSDFSAFVTHGVDKAVQRLAMKKLFSDPHFRVRDGLDVYIDDYTRPDPVSAAMLASLQHAKNALARPVDDAPAQPGGAPAGAGTPAASGRPGAEGPGAGDQSGSAAPGTDPSGANDNPAGDVPGTNNDPGGDVPGINNDPGGDVPPPPEGDA
jgi:hypothetical protein